MIQKNLHGVEEQYVSFAPDCQVDFHASCRLADYVLEAAGLDSARYSPHSLRSCHCTSAARAGVEERVLQQQTGVTVLSAGVDEVPMVYKDIASIMRAQQDLVEPVDVGRHRGIRLFIARVQPAILAEIITEIQQRTVPSVLRTAGAPRHLRGGGGDGHGAPLRSLSVAVVAEAQLHAMHPAVGVLPHHLRPVRFQEMGQDAADTHLGCLAGDVLQHVTQDDHRDAAGVRIAVYEGIGGI